ncbi:MAG: aspartate carbamoyltransferase [Ignavibacterium sp.]|jgi:aspartate carbamoyltransferase catalytic subunit
MNLRHVIESQQFTVPVLRELFDRAQRMETVVKRGGTRDYEHRIMATVFYRPSTRTRFSFEAAMYRLGGKVLSTESARQFSSEIAGEALEDTIRIIGSYCDVIVLRHHERGGAARAAAVSPVPIINAGDGQGGQHPTQALLDLYTIYRECKALDGLTVAFIGALEGGRTVRSLAYLLSKFDRVKLHFVAPQELQIGQDILDHLTEHGVSFSVSSTPQEALSTADVVYQTRIDRERLTKSFVNPDQYNINSHVLEKMKPDAMIMHPLPRSVEIARDVDLDRRAAYFRQSENGLYVRMALLTMLLEE